MELAGAGYLYNLSLLAITFSVVSTLVMLVRQTLGGKLSSFDIYLIVAYVSFGFVTAFDAILPPLLFIFGWPAERVWMIASGVAALLMAINLMTVMRYRHKASREHLSLAVWIVNLSLGFVIVLLGVNCLVAPVRGVGLFAGALTLCLGTIMWAFVRRISSLLGQPSEDWDPTRG